MNLTLRPIGPDDIASIVGLIREFAEFEGLSEHCHVTRERLAAALFGRSAVLEGIIASDDGLAIGYALFFPNFSSFRGQQGLYLDDIYVTAEYRGRGVGEAMLKHLAGIAASRGFERIDFLVLEWNKKAADFYLKLGAVRDEEERHFKFTDDAFRRLAD